MLIETSCASLRPCLAKAAVLEQTLTPPKGMRKIQKSFCVSYSLLVQQMPKEEAVGGPPKNQNGNVAEAYNPSLGKQNTANQTAKTLQRSRQQRS